MISIKFSHVYVRKMPNVVRTALDKVGGNITARLLAVFTGDDANFSPQLVKYDTAYFKNEYSEATTANKVSESDIAYYPLPKGKKLFLLLGVTTLEHEDCPSLHIFPTIRRWDVEKEKYYFSHIGEEVMLERVEDKR